MERSEFERGKRRATKTEKSTKFIEKREKEEIRLAKKTIFSEI